MTLLCNKLKSSYSGVSYLAVNEKTKLRVAHGAEAFGRRPCLAVRVTLHTYRDNNKAKQTTRKINLKPNPNKETRKEGKVQETNKVENFLSNKQRHITHTANAPVTELCMLCEPVRRFSLFFFLLPFVILLSQGNEKRRERTEALLLIFATPRLSNSTRSLSLSYPPPPPIAKGRKRVEYVVRTTGEQRLLSEQSKVKLTNIVRTECGRSETENGINDCNRINCQSTEARSNKTKRRMGWRASGAGGGLEDERKKKNSAGESRMRRKVNHGLWVAQYWNSS